jgi:Secretion system C-terminal sorting domain/Leucine Rich repeat
MKEAKLKRLLKNKYEVMKKILLLLLLITGFSNAQIVNIPDPNFKALLLEANDVNYTAGGLVIDTNNDGEIQLSEAQTITSLGVSGNNIEDVTGITSFSNLLSLYFSSTSITTINIPNFQDLNTLTFNNNSILNSINASGAVNLITLNFQNNPQLNAINVSNCISLNGFFSPNSNLTSLNLSGCTSIGVINLELNNFTTIDVSGLTNLQYLYLNGNQLSSINVTGCTNLLSVECMSNQLTTLNFHDLPNLASIRANGNLISSFEMYSLPNLSWIEVTNNPLQNVDVSNLPSLTYLDFGSTIPIEWLNIKNGVYTDIMLSNPNSIIHNICVDESEINELITAPFTLTNPPTTYCTFTLGGNYNTISGTVTFDQNSDGCNVNDLPKPYLKIDMNDGTSIPKIAYTNNNGNYNFYTLTGSFILTPQIENQSWFNFSPTSSTISFANNNNNTSVQNFCLSPIGVHNDVEVTIVPILVARPGFDATYQIIYRNKGNQALSGTVQLSYEDDVLDLVSSTQSPDVQTTGSLTWNYTNLLPFEVRTVSIVMNVNSPMETPAVNIGDQLDFTATINPISGDETPLDNVFGLKQIVVGSFDPNDKICLEGNVVSTSKIGDYLHYNINFENTGTFPATFVVVKDMIDTTKFDISTLQVLHASHPMETRIAGNKVEFIFEDINLGSNQHGNVVFKIKTKSTLVEGNTVTNNANIYFDYNFPIETNTTSTTFQTLSNGEFPIDSSVVIAPNPTKNNVNINCNNTIKSIQLFDVQGRVLFTQLTNDSESSIDVATCTSGIYLVKVITENGTTIEKIIKE